MEVKLKEFQFEVEGDENFWHGVSHWEPETFDIVKQYADQSKAFIDIGAWNGVISLYASKSFNNVLAIEPDVIAFDKLARNIELNNISNTVYSNIALSYSNGTMVLHQSKPGDSMSSLLPRAGVTFETTGFQGVETRRFEDMIEGIDTPIGLIKMDIEGGELLVIPDMKEYLAKNKPPIYISFHPFWFPEDTKSLEIAAFADLLFGIYPVVRDGQINQVSKDQFIEGMNANSFSYLFDIK